MTVDVATRRLMEKAGLQLVETFVSETTAPATAAARSDYALDLSMESKLPA
jgi:hypothetical protein